MNRALTTAEKNNFRTRPQRSIWRVAVHKPASLYSVQISQTPVGHPSSLIQINNATQTGDANLGKKNMTVWIGSIAGASEEGIVRLRENLGATSPTAMAIAESGSGLNRYYLGQWLTVVEEYRPVAKHPFYNTGTSQWLMDLNEAYTDQFDSGNYGPLAIMGPPDAAIMDGGNATMTFQASSSVFVDSTISSALWTFPDGQTANGLETEAAPHSITFTGASPRGAYTTLKLTDNDGETQESRRLTWVFADDTQVPRVDVGDISGGVRSGGYGGTINVFTSGNQDDFPEGAEVIIFEAASYGANAVSIGSNYPGKEHVVMRGWIDHDSVTVNPFSGRISFKIATIDKILSKTHSHDVFHADSTPIAGASKWVEMENMSIDRVMIDIVKYRSTIAEVTDVHLASGIPMTSRINFQSLPKGALWDQIRTNYGEKGTRGLVSSDMLSNIFAMEDVQISGGSAGVHTMMSIRKEDRVDNTAWASDNFDVNSKAEMYGVMVIPGGSSWRGENTSIIPIGGESPGDVMGYYGGTTEHARGLVADSQDRIITWSGNWRAQMNSRFKKVTVPVAGNLRLDSVPQAMVTMSLSSTENIRGISWVNKNFLPTGLKINYSNQSPMTTLELEEVVNGKGGSAITFPRLDFIFPLPTPTPPPLVPPPPPGAVVTFNSIEGSYLLDSVNSRWYQNDTDITAAHIPSAMGIARRGFATLYKSTIGDIYVSHDVKRRYLDRQFFKPATWISKTPSDPPGGTATLANYTWIDADRTNGSNILTLARQNVSGVWNTWMGYSTDFGDSWAWSQITGGGGGGGAASWLPDTPYHDAASDIVTDERQLYQTHFSWSNSQGVGNMKFATNFDDVYAGYVYWDDTFGISARVAEIDFDAGGSINTGSQLVLATTTGGPASQESDRWMAQALTSRDMLVLESILEQDIGGNYNLHLFNARKGSGDRVLSQADDVILSLSATNGPIRDFHIAKSADQEGIVGFGVGHQGRYAKVSVDMSGNISVGAQRVFVSNVGGHLASLTTNTRVAPLGNDWFVVTSSDGSGALGTSTTDDGGPGTNFYCAWLIDGQGASPVNYGPFILPGSITTKVQSTDIVGVSTNKFAVMYTSLYGSINPEDAYFVIGERSGSTINWGTERRIKSAFRTTLFPIDSANVGISRGWGPGASEQGPWISVAEVSGTSANITPPSGLEHTFSNNWPIAMSMSANKIFIVDDDSAEDIFYVTGDLQVGGTGAVKGLGARLSYDGTQAFATYSDDTDLIMGVYSVPSFSETRTVNLGAGTIADVDAGTVSAYPQVDRGRDSADGTVKLFGRMTTVPGIGVLTHVARSTNSGADWIAVETGWGTDHAAGLVKDWTGFGYNAIRNLGTGGAAYYRGQNNLFIVNTLPFQVDPRGFDITSDGFLVAGASNTGTAVRLAYTAPGYPLWYDFTYNYKTTGATTGIAVL